MTARRRPRFVAGLLTAGALAAAGGVPALAQQMMQSGGGETPSAASVGRPVEGYSVTPLLSVAEIFDDNLFSATSDRVSDTGAGGVSSRGREDDFISRFTPGVIAGYRSEPITVLASYDADAEVYARHDELNSFPARQLAALSIRDRPTELATLRLSGGYEESNRVEDFNLSRAPGVSQQEAPTFQVTNLQAARRSSRGYFARPALDYRLSERLTGLAGYGFQVTDSVGSSRNEEQRGDTALRWIATPVDSIGIGYRLRVFSSSGGQSAATESGRRRQVSHTALVGWSRPLTRRLSFALEGGPRFSDRSVDAEGHASLSYLQSRKGSLAVSYDRTPSQAVGEARVITVDGVSGNLRYQALKKVGLWLGLSFSRNRSGGSRADVMQTNAGIGYDLTTGLNLSLSHRFTRQDGTLGSTQGAAADPGGRIDHNVVAITLTAALPFRID